MKVTFAAVVFAFACPRLIAQSVPAPHITEPTATILQPYLDNHILTGAVTLIADQSNVLDLEAI